MQCKLNKNQGLENKEKEKNGIIKSYMVKICPRIEEPKSKRRMWDLELEAGGKFFVDCHLQGMPFPVFEGAVKVT